jgi:hypothetical protein
VRLNTTSTGRTVNRTCRAFRRLYG